MSRDYFAGCVAGSYPDDLPMRWDGPVNRGSVERERLTGRIDEMLFGSPVSDGLVVWSTETLADVVARIAGES